MHDNQRLIAGLLDIANRLQEDKRLLWQDRALLAEILHLAHGQLAQHIADRKDKPKRPRAPKRTLPKPPPQLNDELAEARRLLADNATANRTPPW